MTYRCIKGSIVGAAIAETGATKVRDTMLTHKGLLAHS